MSPKSKRSKRSRRSSSVSTSSSSSDSDSSNSSIDSSFSDILDAKSKKFAFKKRKSGRLAKWIVKVASEKHVKAAREAFKPSVERLDKKYDFSNLFTNPKLDESLYAALKLVKNSSASAANIDPQEKAYRKQTDLVLDMAKPLLFLVNKTKFKKNSSDALALKSLTFLWCHLFKDITAARRLNILSQVHPNHVGLLSRSTESLPIGGDDLFGDSFIKELLAQVQTAALVNNSITPPATSTPSKPSRTPLAGPSSSNPPQRYNDNNRYVTFCLSQLFFFHVVSYWTANFSCLVGHRLFPPFLCLRPDSPDCSVYSHIAGRTSLFSEGWAQLTQDPWVLATVTSGFKLEFIDYPPFQRHIPPNATMDASQFSLCDEEVNALITKGAVVEAGAEVGYISRYFLVPKKGPNNWRPIINLKPLNQFLKYRHFKMEGIVTVRHTVRQGDFMAKIDLTEAYFTIPVFQGHRKFLRFRWKNKTYEYTCLPFGLSSSPWVFTKLLRVAVAFFRRLGIRLVIYLDDLLIVGSSSEDCTSAITQVIATLESLGFSINFKKSETVPSQLIEYIGLITDSLSMSFRLTDKKIADISRLCKEALKKGKCSLRSLAKILGNLNWATYAVPFAPAHYRNLQALFISASKAYNDNLDVFVCLDVASLSDLSWWVNKANFTEGKGLLSTRPDVRLSSDASRTDTESRRPLSSGDWMLSPQAFRNIQSIWEVQVDLFASEWNRQLPRFVSWFPQPQAWKVDAFSFSWKNLAGFCFPPFNLIQFALSKLLREEADAVLVTPFWPSQPWFPTAMELSCEAPRVLHPSPDLLTSPLGESHPLMRNNSIRLIAWRLSGVSSRNAAFRRALSNSSSRHLAEIHLLHTNPPGTLGEVGVFQGIKIPCLLAPQS